MLASTPASTPASSPPASSHLYGADDETDALRAQLREMTVRAQRLELENRRLKQEVESMHIAMELRCAVPPPPMPAPTEPASLGTMSEYADRSAPNIRSVGVSVAASTAPVQLTKNIRKLDVPVVNSSSPTSSTSSSSSTAASAPFMIAMESLKHERTKEELNMIKALLLIQNVDFDYNAEYQSKESNDDIESHGLQKISLSGDAQVLNELMGVRKQVRVLKHCCYILRAQVLQLQLAIPQTVDWVLKSAKGAISHQSQRSRQLEIRLVKLRKLLT